MKRLLTGVVVTVGAAAAAGLGALLLGFAPVNADQRPSALEAQVLGFALRRAVARQAAGLEDPPPASKDDVAGGDEIYREMCARCHGEPGKNSSTLGASFYPPAPLLPGHRTDWNERELFWIIKHGIRDTAMPAWGSLLADEDIHRVAALVKSFR